MRRQQLIDAGVSPRLLDRPTEAAEPKLALYSPQGRGDGRGVAEATSCRRSWASPWASCCGSVILTGAGILLNSVIEEKSSRILEVLLTSASVPEIMGGKILGVMGVTGTVLTVWLSVGSVVARSPRRGCWARSPAVLIGKGLIVYFGLYLVVGYLMYASIFTAVGAFCETTARGPDPAGADDADPAACR